MSLNVPGLTLEDVTVHDIKDHTLVLTIVNKATGGKRRKQFLLPLNADLTALTYSLEGGVFKIQAPLIKKPEVRVPKKRQE